MPFDWKSVPKTQWVKTKCAWDHCRRETKVTHPYCWQHTRIHMKLRVTHSSIGGAGLGLFAAPKPKNTDAEYAFKKGEKVAPYNGEMLNKEEYERRYGAGKDTLAPYMLQITKNKFVDGIRSDSGLGRYANDPRGTAYDKKKNATFTAPTKTGTFPSLTATRNIRWGEEIFVSYGKDYWPGKIADMPGYKLRFPKELVAEVHGLYRPKVKKGGLQVVEKVKKVVKIGHSSDSESTDKGSPPKKPKKKKVQINEALNRVHTVKNRGQLSKEKYGVNLKLKL
jgi:hypothetical protein